MTTTECECGRTFTSRSAFGTHANHCSLEQQRSAIYVGAIEKGRDPWADTAAWRAWRLTGMPTSHEACDGCPAHPEHYPTACGKSSGPWSSAGSMDGVRLRCELAIGHEGEHRRRSLTWTWDESSARAIVLHGDARALRGVAPVVEIADEAEQLDLLEGAS